MSTAASAPEATRLLLTSLHPSVEAHHLRDHLDRCPPAPPALTDLKVLTKPGGASRCLAFAGFKTRQDADRALRWLSGAWVAGERGGSRVKVDWAKETREAPRPAKRLKLSSTSTVSAPQDERFTEFMALMAPRKTLSAASAPLPSPASSAILAASSPPADFTEPVVAALAPSSVTASKAVLQQHLEDDVAGDDSLTDAEYLAKRMRRKLEDDMLAESTTQEWSQGEEGPRPDESPSKADVHEDSIETAGAGQDSARDDTRRALLETGRLFLRNLPYSTLPDELDDLFTKYGPIEQIHIPVDRDTKSSKGLAYVTFRQPPDAVSAFEALDGTSFQGRLLHLLPAVGRQARESLRAVSSTLKGERLAQRKQGSGQAFSWGTLYLNADAALAAVADRLGVAKSTLLDPSAADPAVKVALAEAHTLAEIKRYFESEGVDLDLFGRPGPRSTTCILVKNLPFGTTAPSLRALFLPFGAISRLLVPPSGTLAIVEMADADAAAAAWRGLVYKQFGGSVLYLEKAPAALLSGSMRTSLSAETSAGPAAAAPALGAQVVDTGAADSTSSSAAGSTLFIKNLNFETTTARLQSVFQQLPDFSFARVQTKPDPAGAGKTLSMGFGFVGFRNPKAAAAAREARQGHVLDGHALEVRFAQRNADRRVEDEEGRDEATRAKSVTTKLLVKNVPFEATRAELRQLFGAYGQLKSVRLPRKMDNKTRGFAFLEFATRRDAESAFAALEHTHLLGRHLVLQWATEADESRALSGEQTPAVGRSKANKRKFAME
ncbi:hypothetical protein JCM8097_002107 [Rhodosporidiobolus ruineniae]